MVSREALRNIYKFYLGLFYDVNLSKSDKDALSKAYPKLRSVFVQGSREDLLKFGKYVLLFQGKQEYKNILAYDIIFNYFNEVPNTDNPDDGVMSWFDVLVPLFIINYLASTPKNKMLPDAMNYLITSRMLNNKVTIVLSEVDLPEVKTSFDLKDQLNLKSILHNVVLPVIKEVKPKIEVIETEEVIEEDEKPKNNTYGVARFKKQKRNY